MVASESHSLDGVATALGAGAPIFGNDELHPSSPAAEEQREQLRLVLHLNLAAAALKLSTWDTARIACQYVLMVQGSKAPSKALFRLAKAHEGEDDLPEAIQCLERLLASEADNADARKLLDSLYKRQAAIDHAAASPKVEYLRKRQEDASAAASEPAIRDVALLSNNKTSPFETMSGADFARLSQEDQLAMIAAINSGLDAEMGGDETTAFDTAALQAVLARA